MTKAHGFLAYIIGCTIFFWWPVSLSSAGILKAYIPPGLIMIGAMAMVFGTLSFAASDGGPRRLNRLFGSLVDVRHGQIWWLFALVPALCLLIAQLVIGLSFQIPGFTLLSFTVFIPLTVLIEEFIWRGYAQPKLQETHTLFTTGMILAGVWLLFRLPFYFIPEYNPWGIAGYLAWAPWYVMFMLFLTWMGANTRYSIFLAVLSHALVNWVGSEWFDPPEMENYGALGGAVLLILFMIVLDRSLQTKASRG